MRRTLVIFMAIMACVSGLSLSMRGADLTAEQIDSLARTPDFVKVSLIVVTPGEKPYSILGHEAIRLQCPMQDLDYCYSFEQQMQGKYVYDFLKGEGRGGYVAIETPGYIEMYRREGRGIKEIPLNLNPLEKQRLWMIMDGRLEEGQTSTVIDHMNVQCSSMCVWPLMEALDEGSYIDNGELPPSVVPTMRGQLAPHRERAPWACWWWNLVIGTEGDEEREASMLITPYRQEMLWQNASVVDKEGKRRALFAGKSHKLLEQTKEDNPFPLTPEMVFGSLLILTLLITVMESRGSWKMAGDVLDTLLLIWQTSLGLLLLWLKLFSSLPATDGNWYLWVYNPLPLLLWLILRRKSGYFRVYWLYSGILVLMLLASPLLPQATLGMQLPLCSMLVRTLYLGFFRQRKGRLDSDE